MVTMFVMPLSFSIAAGISLGFLTFVTVRLIAGRGKEISAGCWLLTVLGIVWMLASTAL